MKRPLKLEWLKTYLARGWTNPAMGNSWSWQQFTHLPHFWDIFLFVFPSESTWSVSDGKESFWVGSICFWVCAHSFTTPWMQLGPEGCTGNRESSKHMHCYRFIQKLMQNTGEQKIRHRTLSVLLVSPRGNRLHVCLWIFGLKKPKQTISKALVDTWYTSILMF